MFYKVTFPNSFVLKILTNYGIYKIMFGVYYGYEIAEDVGISIDKKNCGQGFGFTLITFTLSSVVSCEIMSIDLLYLFTRQINVYSCSMNSIRVYIFCTNRTLHGLVNSEECDNPVQIPSCGQLTFVIIC